MTRLVIEVRDDLSAEMAKHLIAGLEFAGQRVGANLKVHDLDEEAAVLAIEGVVTSHMLPGHVEHEESCPGTTHCGCGPTSLDIAREAFEDALKAGAGR